MKKCPRCNQQNADWADHCGRCGFSFKFAALDLDDAFEEFMRKTNPSVEQHSVQFRECRRAFYAGVTVLYFHQTGAMLDASEARAVAELESIGMQLAEFKLRVASERD